MKKVNWKIILISASVTIGSSLIGFLLSLGSKEIYESLNLPAFAPPSWLFGVAWPVIYVLMGVSLYLIMVNDSAIKGSAIEIFFIQLVVNLLWPLAFFRLKLFIVALVILMILIALVIIMIKIFYGINKTSAYLQIPYLAWITFATVLNFAVVLMN